MQLDGPVREGPAFRRQAGKDVQWVTNVPQPDLMKMLGQKQVDATDLAYQFGYFAQNNKWGPIIAVDDEIDPDGAVGLYAARTDFVKDKRDVMVRFAMAYLQGVKEFNAAAGDPAKYPEIVDILARSTALQLKTERTGPHCSLRSVKLSAIMANHFFHAFVLNKGQ
jgi:ABC-type nitrate/sulfonate/bicarbonate transport system substrate-binding protein